MPQAVLGLPKLSFEDIHLLYYCQPDKEAKNRVVFNCNAISLVISGVKEVYRNATKTVIRTQEGSLIPEGNSLIAERSVGLNSYSSLVILFPTKRVVGLLDRFPKKHLLRPREYALDLKFQQNTYVKAFVENICMLIQKEVKVPGSLVLHRFEELLLTLVEYYPSVFYSVFRHPLIVEEASLKNLVENNLMENLTLTELAFLAHKSLSSFKRDFEKTYGLTPGKYMRQRKLELAAKEILHGKNPSEIFIDYGYESTSNFIQAFKKKYQMTPKEFKALQHIG